MKVTHWPAAELALGGRPRSLGGRVMELGSASWEVPTGEGGLDWSFESLQKEGGTAWLLKGPATWQGKNVASILDPPLFWS